MLVLQESIASVLCTHEIQRRPLYTVTTGVCLPCSLPSFSGRNYLQHTWYPQLFLFYLRSSHITHMAVFTQTNATSRLDPCVFVFS